MTWSQESSWGSPLQGTHRPATQRQAAPRFQALALIFLNNRNFSFSFLQSGFPLLPLSIIFHSNLFFPQRFYLFIFRERGREGEREGEKHQCARETLIGCSLHALSQRPAEYPQLRHVPWLGIELVTSVWGMMPNLLSHTSRGWALNLDILLPWW